MSHCALCSLFFKDRARMLLHISDTLLTDRFDHTRIFVISTWHSNTCGRGVCVTCKTTEIVIKKWGMTTTCTHITWPRRQLFVFEILFSVHICYKTKRKVLQREQIIIRKLFYSPELSPIVSYWKSYKIYSLQRSTRGKFLLFLPFLLFFEFPSFFLKNSFSKSFFLVPPCCDPCKQHRSNRKGMF